MDFYEALVLPKEERDRLDLLDDVKESMRKKLAAKKAAGQMDPAIEAICEIHKRQSQKPWAQRKAEMEKTGKEMAERVHKIMSSPDYKPANNPFLYEGKPHFVASSKKELTPEQIAQRKERKEAFRKRMAELTAMRFHRPIISDENQYF